MSSRLSIITTHPIQYNVPFFVKLAKLQEVTLKVFYTYNPQLQRHYDREFGKSIEWDIPLEEGYDFEYVENTSSKPGTSHRQGIINPYLISAIESFNPKAILVYGWNYSSHWKCLRHFHGVVPILFRGDSTLIDQMRPLKRWIRTMYLRRAYKAIDYALYCGSANKAYFEHHGLDERQLVSVSHAVDNDRFATTGASLRDQWNIPDSAIVVLFAGKFIPKKSPDLLIKSFLKLQPSTDLDIYLVLVGSGELQSQLLEMSYDSEKVRIQPFVNQREMPSVYASCDIFCLPSSGPGETWGLAVNEAMAAGKAILVSDRVGCAQDLVRSGENGYVFTSDLEDDLFEKLKLMVLDKEKIRKMGAFSSRFIKMWNYQTGVNNLSQLLSSL